MFKAPDTVTEFDKAYDLICQLHESIFYPFITRDEYEKRLKDASGNGYRQVLFIDNAEIIGLLGFRILNDLTRPRRLLVDELVVDRVFRGQGYSKKLLNLASDIAKRNDCIRIDLEVALKNTVAFNAYEKQNYEKIAYLMKKML